MQIYSDMLCVPAEMEPCSVALGYFDGVHLGHRAVLEKARSCAEKYGVAPAVFTFVPPVVDGPKGRQILSGGQKHRALADLGMAYCFEPDFAEFQALSARQFFEQMLLGKFNARAVSCGEDFGFGANRGGNVAMLREFCEEHGVDLQVVPTTMWGGRAIGSSRIREALQAGDVPAVNAMLGRPYAILLPVEHGRGLGAGLGFPTINQVIPLGMQPPARGVYITQTVVDGAVWPSATSYGTRPTIDDSTCVTCETFIVGFAGDLYGKEVEVRFFERVADVRRFETKAELVEAVHEWAEESQRFFEQGIIENK